MAINLIHTNKLLRLLYFSEQELRKALKNDINQEKKKAEGENRGGGNFYSPFWADTRKHILGEADLSILTADRIKNNPGRRNLYPLLEKGVLVLWERGHNLDVKLLKKSPKDRFKITNEDLTAKVESIMAIEIKGDERLVYPYWFPDPKLSDEAARVGLWLLSKALLDENAQNIRIFDIIRSKYFSLQSHPLQGNEEQTLIRNYRRISEYRRRLLEEE